MNNPDDRLRALFAQDLPLPRDPAFSAAVMGAVMRRQFLEDLSLLSVVSVVGGGVLCAIWPILATAASQLSQDLGAIGVALALATCIGIIVGGRVTSALGLES